jgi:hypothetical protein
MEKFVKASQLKELGVPFNGQHIMEMAAAGQFPKPVEFGPRNAFGNAQPSSPGWPIRLPPARERKAMSTDQNNVRPSTPLFDGHAPRPLGRPDPQGGYVHPAQFENSHLSRQPLKSTSHGGDRRDGPARNTGA